MKTVVIHGRGKSTFAYNGEAEHWGLIEWLDSRIEFDKVYPNMKDS